MAFLLSLLQQYGYWILFGGIFLEAVGLPIPSAPILITAGAAAHLGTLNPLSSLAIAVMAMLTGDLLLFLAGRYSGWAILGMVCRLSASPENCIFKSAESFYRRGKQVLLFSKFIPGMSLIATPLAGSLNMRLRDFLSLDSVGSLLYISAYFGTGYFFSHLVSSIIDGFSSLHHGLLLLLLAGFAIYLAHRIRQYRKLRLYRKGNRITVDELLQKMAQPDWQEKSQLIDVRSHGYYDPKAQRIQGSLRIEPNHVLEEMHRLPREKELYLYCT
jgi:membrane protein DedA with SNARE-associated domain